MGFIQKNIHILINELSTILKHDLNTFEYAMSPVPANLLALSLVITKLFIIIIKQTPLKPGLDNVLDKFKKPPYIYLIAGILLLFIQVNVSCLNVCSTLRHVNRLFRFWPGTR